MKGGKPVRNLVGERFGLLFVLEPSGFAKGRALWRCACDCGATTVKVGNLLQQGKVKSCGCASTALTVAAKRTHGHAGSKGKTSAYERWKSIKQRCGNPRNHAWRNYGGRGIKICERWASSFEAFYADVGDPPEPHLTLDRINNDGNYEPGNVRWATRVVQANNARHDHRGLRNARAKLTEDDVRFIRASTVKRSVLAEIFGLAPTYISSIRTGKWWKHVT